MVTIVITGSPGSGKTYLARRLAAHYGGKAFLEAPDEGFPGSVQGWILNPEKTLQAQLWFRNRIVSLYLEAKQYPGIAIMDQVYYGVTWFGNFKIKHREERDLIHALAMQDREAYGHPDVTIYLKTTPESARAFLEQRTDFAFENEAYKAFISALPPFVDAQMKALEPTIPALITLERADWDFAKPSNLEKLAEIIKEKKCLA